MRCGMRAGGMGRVCVLIKACIVIWHRVRSSQQEIVSYYHQYLAHRIAFAHHVISDVNPEYYS